MIAGGFTSDNFYFQNSDFALARYVITATPDTVTIGDAVYVDRSSHLRVQAASSVGGRLDVYNSFTNQFIGTLPPGGDATFSTANPRKITVKSSMGGSADALVRSPRGRSP